LLVDMNEIGNMYRILSVYLFVKFITNQRNKKDKVIFWTKSKFIKDRTLEDEDATRGRILGIHSPNED